MSPDVGTVTDTPLKGDGRGDVSRRAGPAARCVREAGPPGVGPAGARAPSRG